MQEFCPSCTKNGVKSKIRAFQLNFEEAVFMCSAENCIWPVGFQNLTFINRPVGKDWSENWDEAVAKQFKSESDPLLELSAYTPPQTPGTELGGKDVSSVTSSAIKVETTTVPDKTFYSKTVENIESVESFEQNGFADLDIILNSNFDNDISSFDNDIKSFDKDISNFDNGISSLKKEVKNYKILKPKLVITNPINYKVEKGITNDPVFIKQCDRTTVLDKNSDRQINCTNGTIINKTTSLVCKCEVNNPKPSILKVSPRKEISRLSIRSLRRKKSNVKSFEKFDFNDLMEQKAKKIKNDQYKKESIKTENSQNIIKVLKMENNSAFSFDLDKMLIETSTNMSRINNLELSNYNEKIIRCNDKDQIDFDSILGLTSSSKDSGVDQDMVDNIDMDLEELLAGFSDDLTSSMNYNAHNHNTHKIPIEETDENKWINSLFE